MAVSIELVGSAEIIRRLDPAQLERAITGTFDTVGPLVQTQAQIYPPPLRYVRTYKLQNSWRQRRASPTEHHIESVDVHYAPWVMDANRQARIHQGRWQTDRSLASDFEPVAQRELERLAQAILNGS